MLSSHVNVCACYTDVRVSATQAYHSVWSLNRGVLPYRCHLVLQLLCVSTQPADSQVASLTAENTGTSLPAQACNPYTEVSSRMAATWYSSSCVDTARRLPKPLLLRMTSLALSVRMHSS